VRRAWKGYPFDVLNVLEDRGLIHQSRKAKSVMLTEEGVELARELEKRYKP
jgi:predicted transcriptional regulator